MNSNQSIGTGRQDDGKPATPERDGSQRETGGSGGAGLTASQVGNGSMQSSAQGNAQSGNRSGDGAANAADNDVEGVDGQVGDIASNTRGAQDTRSRQSGGELGARETGANQTPDDLSPSARPRR